MLKVWMNKAMGRRFFLGAGCDSSRFQNTGRFSVLLCFLVVVVFYSGLGCSEQEANPSANQSTNSDPNKQKPDLDSEKKPRIQCGLGEEDTPGGNRYLIWIDGLKRERICAKGKVCDVQAAALQSSKANSPKSTEASPCVTPICDPEGPPTCASVSELGHCNAIGTRTVVEPCGKDETCFQGKCLAETCTPGEKRCGDVMLTQICGESGRWEAGTTCGEGTQCEGGECITLCDFNSKVASNVGCEYWSVDLPNYDDAISQPHAVVVSNVHPTQTANVKFYEGNTKTEITSGAGISFNPILKPNEIRVYSFDPGYDHSGTRLLQDKAIRLSSDVPVIAYQYNPLHNAVKVYSNDGTMLLPTNAVGEEYFVLGWTHRDDIPTRGFLTIVNSSGVPNRVTITPSAQVVAGDNIPTIEAGEQRTFDLAAGASINLETSGIETPDAQAHGCLRDHGNGVKYPSPCPDLTGTHIKANDKVTVFAGHMCANVPMDVDRCDHIESILTPVTSWGKWYVGTKFFPRISNPTATGVEPDFFRVIAADDNTQIKTSPAITGIHNKVLNKGEWVEFIAREHFVLHGSKPVMVTQYMTGSNWIGIPRKCNKGQDQTSPTGIGDPAMALLVPKAQWRKQYNVLTPQSYEQDYFNIIAYKRSTISLDGSPIPEQKWVPVGSSEAYKVAVVRVNPGKHELSGDDKFGVMSYGYACHVSYATAGGMNVEDIYERL